MICLYSANYKEYVEKYAKDRGITFEEAEEHQIVKEVKKYYEKKPTETTKTCGWGDKEV